MLDSFCYVADSQFCLASSVCALVCSFVSMYVYLCAYLCACLHVCLCNCSLGNVLRSARPSKCQSFQSSGLNFEPFLITLGSICKHFRTIWVAFWGLGAIPPKIFEKGVKKNVSCFLCVFVRVCLYVCECGCLCKCLCMSVCVWLLSLAFALEGPWVTEGRASLH